MMERLHNALAQEMEKILTEGVTALDPSGDIVKLTPGASYLSAIRQFLKDNNIESGSSADSRSPFNSLVNQALPFLKRDAEEGADADS